MPQICQISLNFSQSFVPGAALSAKALTAASVARPSRACAALAKLWAQCTENCGWTHVGKNIKTAMPELIASSTLLAVTFSTLNSCDAQTSSSSSSSLRSNLPLKSTRMCRL